MTDLTPGTEVNIPLDDDTFQILSRLDALTQTQQRWVWDVAKILHDTAQYTNVTCFQLALDALADDSSPCEACGIYVTYPEHHARIADQGYTCPLAENDDPAYAAHIILTEDLTNDEHRENMRTP